MTSPTQKITDIQNVADRIKGRSEYQNQDLDFLIANQVQLIKENKELEEQLTQSLIERCELEKKLCATQNTNPREIRICVGTDDNPIINLQPNDRITIFDSDGNFVTNLCGHYSRKYDLYIPFCKKMIQVEDGCYQVWKG